MTPGRRSATGIALAFGAYLLLAAAFTWPLAAHATQHVVGHVPRESVPPLNVWAMSAVLHNLARQPLRLFDGNAFYPYRDTVAFSEHLFVPALLSAPFYLLTGNWALAYNAVTFLTLATAGLGMYLLARELTGHDIASFAAGGLYAFHTWNVNELVRLQILSNQYFPFVLLGLVAYFARPGIGRATAVALAATAQALSGMYWALYLPWFAAATIAYLQWRHRLPLRRLFPLLAGLGLALALAALFAIPYVRSARLLGFRRALPDPLLLDRYFDVLPQNLLYAPLLGTARYDQNAAHFLGFATVALAATGLLTQTVTDAGRRLRPFLAALAAAGFLLSLGPRIETAQTVFAPGPYLLLYRFVPGFQNVRYPERLSVFLVLGLAPLVAMGLAAWARHLRRGGALLAAAFVLLEHLSVPQGLSPLPSGASVPSVYRWLAGRADVRVVAEVPVARFQMERMDALPMYFSAIHHKPSVVGFSGYFPPSYNFIRWRLFHFPDAESVDFLERFGVDTIVVSPAAAGRLVPDARWELHGPFPEGHVVVKLRYARPAIEFAPPAPAVGLVELPRRGWEVQASAASPEAAIDGDEATAWRTAWRQAKGDFYRVRFPSALRVARVTLAVAGPYQFPMRLKLVGERTDGEWAEIPFDRDRAYDRLFTALLYDPRRASLEIDIPPTELTALRLRIAETDFFWMPWVLTELRLYGPSQRATPLAEPPLAPVSAER